MPGRRRERRRRPHLPAGGRPDRERRPLMAEAQKLGISGRELAAMIDDWEARR
jgi:hypothetical protein